MEDRMIEFSNFIKEDTSTQEAVAGKGRELYFAFGHNTFSKDFRERAPEAHFIGKAIAKGYRFDLKEYSDIDKDSGSEVHGILWSIPKGEEPTINKYEAYYKKINIDVHFNGKKIRAYAYKIKSDHYNGKPPSKEYIKVVHDGYAEHGLPLNQLNKAVSKVKKEKD